MLLFSPSLAAQTSAQRTPLNYQFDIVKDSLILLELYRATRGDQWTHSWDLSQPMNSWHGLYMEGDGSGYTLNLSNNGLRGTLPEQLNSLTGVTHIKLEGNLLNGSVDISGQPPEQWEYEQYKPGLVHREISNERVKSISMRLQQLSTGNPEVAYRTLHQIRYEDWQGSNECFFFRGHISMCYYQSYESQGVYIKMEKDHYSFKQAYLLANTLLEGKLQTFFGPAGEKIPHQENFENETWPDQRSYAESRIDSGAPVYTIATEDCGEWNTFREEDNYYIVDIGYGC